MSARESNPLSKPSGMVGQGAILYDTREPRARSCCARSDGRHLYHVTNVYEETESGAVRFEVWDGTHTTREWVHGDDLLAMFEPAGWSVSAGVKPTYILTRQHGVEDRHDIMTDGGDSA